MCNCENPSGKYAIYLMKIQTAMNIFSHKLSFSLHKRGGLEFFWILCGMRVLQVQQQTKLRLKDQETSMWDGNSTVNLFVFFLKFLYSLWIRL